MPKKLLNTSGLGLMAVLFFLPKAAHANGFVDWISSDAVLDRVYHVATAIGILFGGWLLARMLSNATFALLSKTDLDNKLAKALGIDLLLEGRGDKKNDTAVERFGARLVYYVLMLFVIIAALDFAGLSAAAGPLSNFLDTVVGALPLIGKAVLILTVAYFAGLILRKLTTLALKKTGIDARFSSVGAEEAIEDGVEAKAVRPFSETAGAMIFWLLMLVGLAGAFEALKVEAIALPLRSLLDKIILLLPAVGVAALILAGGFVLGRIVQSVVKNLLNAAGFDTIATRLHLEQLFKKRTPSDMVGGVLMLLVMLHAAIASLDRLGLDALSRPISQTIDQFWGLLPALTVSAVILVLGVVLGRMARTLVEGLLASVGLDRWLARMGLDLSKYANQEVESERRRIDTPSELAGVISQFAVTMIAVVQVLDNLNLHRWAVMVEALLAFTFLRVLVALVIVAAGFALGNYVKELVKNSRSEADASADFLSNGARAAVLVFTFTMAIHQLHVAPTFVLLTFGLLFGALCLALALAFGLGSRDFAGELVKRQVKKVSKPED